MPTARKSPRARKATPKKSDAAKFVWTSQDGVRITLATEAARVKVGTLRKIRQMNELDAAFALLECVCDEANLAKLDELDVSELNQLMTAWQKASGVQLPEA